MNIKQKIESVGKPLKDWDIQIYRGILTGFNEAFIIDGKTKDALIAKSPKSAEVIRPLLRGRDVKKWYPDYQNLWLIFIPWHFPLHGREDIAGNSEEANQAFQVQYPDLHTHLLHYKTELTNRNISETGIRYEWYALQRCAATYYNEFDKPKIIYPNMTKHMPFIYDEIGYFTNDKGFIVTGKNLKYLTILFNSNLFKYCFRDNFPELLGGTRELRKIFFDKIPIKTVTENEEQEFNQLMDKITSKSHNINILEKEANDLIYKHYNLSKEEIAIIEQSKVLKETQYTENE